MDSHFVLKFYTNQKLMKLKLNGLWWFSQLIALKMLSSHMWLMATVLDNTDLDDWVKLN